MNVISLLSQTNFENLIFFDVGGTKIKAARYVGNAERVLREVATPNSEDALLRTLMDMREEVIEQETVCVLGLPGPICSSIKRPWLPPIRVSVDVEKLYRVGFEVIVNDMFLHAYIFQSLGRFSDARSRDSILIYLGTSVGVGLIVRGAIFSLEIAHLPTRFFEVKKWSNALTVKDLLCSEAVGCHSNEEISLRVALFECVLDFILKLHGLSEIELVIGGGVYKNTKALPFLRALREKISLRTDVSLTEVMPASTCLSASTI